MQPMSEDEVIEAFGLPPAVDAAAEIRARLERETDLEYAAQGRGDTLAMRALCAQLFMLGAVDDARLIWRAKSASMDAASSIDVQLLCGAGLAETRAALSAMGGPLADGALRRIDECVEAGDFDELSVDAFAVELLFYYRAG